MTTRPRLAVPQIALAISVLLAGCSAPVTNPATPGAGASPGADASPSLGSGSTAQPAPPIAAEPSRASVIQQAVAEGRLDQTTALLYRAYSALGLPGVPAEFMGAPPRRDDSVFTSIVTLLPTLSSEQQAQFNPLLVRPTNQQSVFYAQPSATIGSATVAVDPHPTARCAQWAHSADLDSRFKVWACADADAAAAEIDIAQVVVLLQDIWDEMTAPLPAGMGDPLPDGAGPNIPADVGGDARIDFYLLSLGEVVNRDYADIAMPEGAIAAAIGEEAPNASSDEMSGFVLLNRDRLSDEVSLRQDVIHEFFHVLQYAHDVSATHSGGLDHWFVEASATWAEIHYYPEHSDIPHARFPGDFQPSPAGLESQDPDHEYAAYIWPFFMEQESDGRGTPIFNAWQAIGGVASGGFAAVTQAISDQLSFDRRFRDFAVRNLNLTDVLTSAGQTQYVDADLNFFDDHAPGNIVPGTITPGQPYLSPPGGAAPLAADYYRFDVTEEARDVTVSLANISPASQVDGDALVHVVGGKWERRPFVGGKLKFCRDEPRDDIDQLYVVVSNHSPAGPLLGFLEASAKDRCASDEIILQGTIRGTGNYVNSLHNRTMGRIEVTMEVTITITLDDWTSTGTATVSGEFTGDCEYSDSDSGQMTPAGMHIFDPADPTDMIAYVSVVEYDPRFSQRPLTGLYLSVFGRTAGEGGTCGHVFGPVEDAFPSLQVSLGGCNFFEILNNDGTWHGECSESSPSVDTETGRPHWEHHWTANLEQISPRETPAPGP